ncbi:MAG: hypothetical protein ABJ004_03250 [Cyclobacteriaceae bacterium]
MKLYRLLLCTLHIVLSSNYLCAQTGPGGVGSSDGNGGQPQNILWLDASTLSLANDASVTTWADLSGNANDLGQLGSENLPIFRNDGLASGSYDVVRFDGSERYLSVADNSSISGLPGVSIIMVFQSSALGGPRGILSKRESSSSNEEYSIFSYTNDYINFDIRTTSDSRSNTDPVAITTSTDYIFSAVYGSSSKSLFSQSVQAGSSQSKSGTINDGTAPLILGALNENYGTYFAGDIAEIILYNQGLNRAQRLMVENYLSEKYNITITNDFYNDPGGYGLGIAGVGNDAGETHDEAYVGGMTLQTYDGTFASGEFVMAAHNNHSASIVTDSLNGNAVMQERWSKSWYLDKTGNMNLALAFDFGDVISGQYPQETADYRLIRRNGANYDIVTTASVYVSDDNLVFNVEDANLADGYYSIATVDNSTAPLDGGAQKVWYSYKSGNWEDPLSWTLDGAATPLYVNPGSAIPTGSDRVVIASGKTISMLDLAGSADYNNASVAEIEVIGELDLGTSYGHNAGTLLGTGKVILDGNSVSDELNFVGGDVSGFIGSEGGTVEIQGDGLEVVSTQTFNNLIVNLDNPSNVVTLLSDLLLVGDFTVSNGIFRINDASLTALSIDLYGDLYVGANGEIATGSGDARHQFNFYGDFVNDGYIAFTQRTTPVTGSEATDGIVDANFLNDNADQTIQCNNTTHFYRIEIDKGEDDTYTLNIEAGDASYFNLNGYAAQSHSSTAQLTSNSNALGLLKGTVRLATNVDVDVLNTGGNYNISEKAKLWIDGGSATKSGGTAIVPYGGVLVSEGSLTASINSGITTRGNGYLNVTGGKVLMNQFRTSVYGSVNQGGYRQSGGEVYVSGGSTSTSYYAFSSTYEGNTFSMTGGLLTVNANSRGGIFINGSPGNFNVTGGTIVCELDNNNDFVITSKAPFNNLIVRKTTSNSGYVILDGGTSANGSSDPRTLAAQDLVILDDLVIENSSASYVDFYGNAATTGFNGDFRANNVDMHLYGNIEEQAGAMFTSGTNTITFEGEGTNRMIFDPASSQSLNNVTIDKNFYSSGVMVEDGNVTSAITLAGDLTLEGGKLFYQSFNIEAQGNIYLSDTIGQSGSAGKLLLSGSGLQTLTSDGGAVFNLELDNSNGADLSGDLAIRGTLTLTDGVFDINTDQLILSNEVAGSGFGTTKMIQTSGNASDEGLRIYIDGGSVTETVLFPIGTDQNSVRYTPLLATLSSIDNDGFITLKIADTELQTVDLGALSNNLLTYYWTIGHSGFEDGTIPNVDSYVFSASDADDPDAGATPAGFNANFVPGKVLDELPYTRLQENTSDITGLDIVFDGSGSGFALENANYTAGDGTSNLFVGSPTIYYSRATNGNWWEWQETNHWSTDQTDKHIGAPAGAYPSTGDIAVIGSDYVNALTGGSYSQSGTGRHQVRIDNTVGDVDVAEIIFNSVDGGTAQNVSDMSRVRVRGNITLTAGVISGEGEMVQDIGSSAAQTGTIIADLGEFVKDPNNGWFFWFQSAADVTINDRFDYPIFRTFGGFGTLDFSQDITAKGAVIDNGTTLSATTNYNIDGQVSIGSNGAGTLEFPNVGSDVLFECNEFVFSDDPSNSISVANSGSDTHTLCVRENIVLDQGTGFDLTSVTGAQVILQLKGEGKHSFVNNTGTVAELYRVVINKGSDSTSGFTFSDDFNLSGGTGYSTADSLPVVIENGLLVLNNASIDITLANGGASFEIPTSGGLEIMQGQASISGDDTGILLDGLLRISGGTLNLNDVGSNGNNFIEYSSSGSAVIEVTGGELLVGSQVRRSLTATTGILKYRQDGGAVTLGINAAPESSRGVFEVVNSGSEFDFTAGTFTIVRGVNSTTVPSLLIEPESYDVDGSTIVIGNADTPSGSSSSMIGIKASIDLFNLEINNDSGNDPTALLYSRPLTIEGTLTLDADATFNSNGFDITLNGDFVNDGIYVPSGNTTIFSAAAGSQAYSGTGTSAFYNLEKSGGGILNLSQDIFVDNDFEVLQGTVSHGSSAINVMGDVTIQSTVQTSSGSGVVFTGTETQQLFGKSNVDIDLGRITISNSNGVEIPEGNGYTFTITDALRLSQGVLDIGGSLLTIGKDGIIEELSTFSTSNMIQTNSSFADNGVKKIFSGSEPSFVFPVGETKYTPLEFTTISSIDEDSYVTVRPANEYHPAVSDDIGTGDDETENTLQYHWVVKSSGMTNAASGTAQFTYDQSDVSVTGAFTESDYIAARLTTEEYQWDKAYAGTAINTINNTMTFPLDESVNFAGEYTAGIDNAFRDVPEYRSNGDVTFSSSTNWEVSLDGGTNWGVASTVPAGARVTVSSGDEVTVDDNNVRLLSTEIESGGRLVIGEGYYGTRLGEVSGTGALVLQNEIFPSGNYENFLTCSGGELEYSSSNSYSILSGISNVRAVTLSGSGSRTIPSNSITICDDLTVDGPTLIKDSSNDFIVEGNLALNSGSVQLTSASAKMEVQGNATFSAGSFVGFSGADVTFGGDLTLTGATFTPNNADFFFNGAGVQNITGTFNFRNVTVENTGAGLDLTSGGALNISGILTLTDGIIATEGSNKITITSTGSYTGASLASYISGPITRNTVSASATYTFPVGKGGRYSPVTISNVSSGGQNWTAEYFTSAVDATVPTTAAFDDSDAGSGYNALTQIQANDRWNVTSSGSNTAFVKLTYGAHNSFPTTEEIRVTWWDSGDSQWENQGGIVSGNTTSGVVTSENAIHFSSQEFGMGNAPESALPVELIFFRANLVDQEVVLTWQTATEIDNSHFVVERSIDGNVFEGIAEVSGNGTTTDIHDYEFVDTKPYQGKSYYRLKQVDFDGDFAFSPLVYVFNDQAHTFDIDVYPNPGSLEEITLEWFTTDAVTPIQYSLLGLNGVVFASEIVAASEVKTPIFSGSEVNIPDGVYLLIVRQGTNSKQSRLIIAD